jgi:septal ring factor EnvC (AmiA/AmiB activator)
MRALFLTNHFREYAGSEMVVLELAEEFRRRGHEAEIRAVVIGGSIVEEAIKSGVCVSTINGEASVDGFDMVWCQHGTLANVEQTAFGRDPRPLIVTAHLSPYEPLELITSELEERAADFIVVNSSETQEKLKDYFSRETTVFFNAAPTPFFTERSHAPELRRVLSVSNHLPPELVSALARLETEHGVAVTRVGSPSAPRRLQPADILDHDAVISIGKTVQYALASRTPVFVYDHFGGPGWLSAAHFVESKAHNFSGRPHCRKLDEISLVAELKGGYADAIRSIDSFEPETLADFNLAAFVAKLARSFEERRAPISCDATLQRLRNQALAAIVSIQREVRGSTDARSELQRARAELATQQSGAEAKLAGFTANLDALNRSLSDQAVALAGKDEAIASLTAELETAKSHLQAVVAARDQTIAELSGTIAHLTAQHADAVQQLSAAQGTTEAMAGLSADMQRSTSALADVASALARLEQDTTAALARGLDEQRRSSNGLSADVQRSTSALADLTTALVRLEQETTAAVVRGLDEQRQNSAGLSAEISGQRDRLAAITQALTDVERGMRTAAENATAARVEDTMRLRAQIDALGQQLAQIAEALDRTPSARVGRLVAKLSRRQ